MLLLSENSDFRAWASAVIPAVAMMIDISRAVRVVLFILRLTNIKVKSFRSNSLIFDFLLFIYEIRYENMTCTAVKLQILLLDKEDE